MKGIIVYRTFYGATGQVAQWLGEKTGFPVVEQKKVRDSEIAGYDLIIIGSPVMAHKILLSKWIAAKWELLKDKEVILYSTSGAHPALPELQNVFNDSFEPGFREKIRFFPQGGRMIWSKLKLKDKLLMKIGQMIEKDPKIKVEMVKDKDNVDPKWIEPILQYVTAL